MTRQSRIYTAGFYKHLWVSSALSRGSIEPRCNYRHWRETSFFLFGVYKRKTDAGDDRVMRISVLVAEVYTVSAARYAVNLLVAVIEGALIC